MRLQDISLLQIAGLLKQRLEKSHYYFSPILYIHMIINHGDITGCRKISYMVFIWSFLSVKNTQVAEISTKL